MKARMQRLTTRVRAAMHDLAVDDRGDVPGWVLITLMTAGLTVVTRRTFSVAAREGIAI